MPRGDKTGPNGQGPMTGRGLGVCGGGMRRGFMCGRGFGFRGRLTKTEEAAVLKEEEQILKEELKGVQEEIKNMK